MSSPSRTYLASDDLADSAPKKWKNTLYEDEERQTQTDFTAACVQIVFNLRDAGYITPLDEHRLDVDWAAGGVQICRCLRL